MNIHQFHSGTAAGDAITNQMILIKKLLIKNGYNSNIYAQFIDPKITEKIVNIEKLKCEKEDILIIHHSMGFTCFEEMKKLQCKKILIYHNITPVKYIEDLHMKEYAFIGIEQVKSYKDIVDYAIADSNYNRKQLISFGYKGVDVLPVQISLNRFENIKCDAKRKKDENITKIIFVGRVFPNKCQEDVISAFNMYNEKYNNNSKLFLIGDNGTKVYNEKLEKHLVHLNIKNNVEITGKISEEDLKYHYETADVFVCMSEHEGFGVPLLEAMKMKVPVIAYNSSAIAETLDGAGILMENKNFEEIASIINNLVINKEYKKNIIKNQNNRIKRLEKTDSEKILLKAIDNTISGKRKPSLQMQGPFETSYSLAIVNRKLIESITVAGNYDTSIYATEGLGDYIPKDSDLENNSLSKELYEKSKECVYPDITIRNMYPPRVKDAKGGLNLQAFGWEESKIPKKYVNDFNIYLDGIGTMSTFVTSMLKKNGVEVPIKTMGIGVELPINFENIKPYILQSKKKTKFLHISSCFPRKGVDILLKAYFEVFTGKDDVCLVIKTFPNPHNNVETQIADLKKQYTNYPEIELINKDLPEADLCSLYKAANCYVHVARGEGFGLPVAEAMLAKLPVIVSNNSGLKDFCDEDTAFTVDYEEVEADTHISEKGSRWYEPNRETLKYHMFNFVKGEYSDKINILIDNAYNNIKNNFSWESVANKWEDFIDHIYETKNKLKVDMVTTWNNKCGIAEYTKFLCDAASEIIEFDIYPNYGVDLIKKDGKEVKKRLWHSKDKGGLDDLIAELATSKSKVVHIQFNFGFYDLRELEKLINTLHEDKKIIVTYHSVKDIQNISLSKISNVLNLVTNVVHQKEDIDYLSRKGVNPDAIILIPHGQIEFEDRDKHYLREKLNIKNRLVLGSYGFFLPQKGIKENIIMLKELKKEYPDILYILSCALYDADISKNYYEECRALTKNLNLENNVMFFTDFLNPDESIVLLQLCDVLLMCYLPTQESASGAIRFCVAAKRPIITTKQDIFKEFEACLYQIEENNSNEKVTAIYSVIENELEYKKNIEKVIAETSWKVIKGKYVDLYRE